MRVIKADLQCEIMFSTLFVVAFQRNTYKPDTGITTDSFSASIRLMTEDPIEFETIISRGSLDRRPGLRARPANRQRARN